MIKHSGCDGNIHDHHLIRSSRVLTKKKLTSKEIYDILSFKAVNTNVYFEELH